MAVAAGVKAGIHSVAFKARAGTVAVGMPNDGVGREDCLPASPQRAPGPRKILAEVHVGKGNVAEGTRTNSAGDVIEAQYLEALGRKVAVVNLDPANENYTYPVAADIHDLIDLDAAAAHCELGPNGALVYCFEYSEATV